MTHNDNEVEGKRVGGGGGVTNIGGCWGNFISILLSALMAHVELLWLNTFFSSKCPMLFDTITLFSSGIICCTKIRFLWVVFT